MPPADQSGNQNHGQGCLLIYDGECRLCVLTKLRLERAGVGQPGSDVRFAPYQSDEARRALGENYQQGRPDMAFLVESSGKVREGLEAFLPVASNLPGGSILLWCLRVPLARRLAGWGYRLLARHRYRLFGEA